MKTIKEEIVSTLTKHISQGVYKANDKLPSIRELSSYYHVNPNTISNVYDQLQENGLIFAMSGKGYYVCDRNETLEQFVLKEIKEDVSHICILKDLLHLQKDEVLEIIKKEIDTYD